MPVKMPMIDGHGRIIDKDIEAIILANRKKVSLKQIKRDQSTGKIGKNNY